jgi:hypothetical protein
MLKRTRKVAAASAAFVVSGLITAQAAMAQAVADTTVVDAVTDNAGILVATLTALIIVILGPRLVFILIGFAKKALSKAT